MFSSITKTALWLLASLSVGTLVMWVVAGLFVELGLLPEQ